MAAQLTARPEGHCKDESSWADFSASYGNCERKDLCGGHLTDFEAANAIYLADRTDLDLIANQTVAKDRIRWLSIRLAQEIARADAAEAALANREAA